jgi:large subunit ribosomal protein L28
MVILPGCTGFSVNLVLKGTGKMAVCENCGKTTKFGRNVPWSKKSTPRKFKPNLQKVSVFEDGRSVQKVLCTRCLRTLVKTE